MLFPSTSTGPWPEKCSFLAGNADTFQDQALQSPAHAVSGLTWETRLHEENK